MGVEENVVQAQCLALLRQTLCWVAWRQNQVPVRGRGFTGLRGVSDIIALQPSGPAWFVECKSDQGNLSPKQIEFRDDVIAAGHVYVVARDVQDLIGELENAGVLCK